MQCAWHGHATSPMDDKIKPGQVIAAKFRIERELGRGGMSVVYLAHHLKLGTLVALKVMLPELKGDPDASARFLREARAMARLKSEHVVRVLDVDSTEPGRPYIAMEYVEGLDLSQVLAQRGRLPYAEAVEYLAQTTLALAEAHAVGIVHRDLKPANLLLASRRDGSAVIKVLDFGISKVAPADSAAPITRREISMGTPNYMSPEQLRASSDVGPATDIWALGVLLYQLVTGKLPFLADNVPALVLAVLEQPVPNAQDEVPEVPPELESIVQRCLQRAPEQRFESVEALRDALLAAIKTEQPNGAATTAPDLHTPLAHSVPLAPAAQATRASRGWIAVGAAAAAAISGGGYWVFTQTIDSSNVELTILEPTFGPRTFAAPLGARPPTSLAPVPAGSAGPDAARRIPEKARAPHGPPTSVQPTLHRYVRTTTTGAAPSNDSALAGNMARSSDTALTSDTALPSETALPNETAARKSATVTSPRVIGPQRRKSGSISPPPPANTLGGRL